MNLNILDGNRKEKADLLITDNGDNIILELKSEYKSISITKEHSFAFFALQEIRKELEKLELYIQCQGARTNVYPSGMLMDSFDAYELEIGKAATCSVYIFEGVDYTDGFGKVDEQEHFYDMWIKSVWS